MRQERIVNGRHFLPIGNKKWLFDRSCYYNLVDIIGCATMGLHKSIIGICQMEMLEQAERDSRISLRPSKAIQVYYVMYHLFTCCMILDSDYEILFRASEVDYYAKELSMLRRLPYSAEDWVDRRLMETDLATRIGHSQIRDYCQKLRKNDGIEPLSKAPYISLMYNWFIRDDCELILFEKAYYIRDRIIYRPSRVTSDADAPIQTSKHVRDQIDSEPSAEALYDNIKELYRCICASTVNSEWMFSDYFRASCINSDSDHLEKLGYFWENLEPLGVLRESKSIPSYLYHLIELYSPEQVQYFYKRFWVPLWT